MLTSLALIFLVGLAAASICQRIRLPRIIGMLATGILLGPYVLDFLDGSILSISSDLREMALVIILIKAGLSLDISELKEVGRPAVLMAFLAFVLLAPGILGVTLLEAAILGAVLGAVSPAVVVPKMVQLMETGYGTDKGIPQLILAGASVDDIFVIVMFSAFTGLAQGGAISPVSFLRIPLSILSGILMGIVIGYGLARYFGKIHMRDTAKVLLLLSIAFLLVSAEDRFTDIIPFSALIAVMCIGISLKRERTAVACRLAAKFNKLWVAAEIILFVLVGATVDLKYATAAGPAAIILIVCVLIFRMAGVLCCLLKTRLNMKERLFCMIAYMPKATVQAAIGGIPLAMGLPCGNIVLTVAVLAILITAPLGAFLIEFTYKKLLA
jgi:NhaP-type Na+/H+ or K+/H+ antiporter